MLDTDGKPVRRFEPGAPLTELRLAIADVLRSRQGLSNGTSQGGRGTASPRWDNRLLQASRRFYAATTEPVGLTTPAGRSDMGPYVGRHLESFVLELINFVLSHYQCDVSPCLFHKYHSTDARTLFPSFES